MKTNRIVLIILIMIFTLSIGKLSKGVFVQDPGNKGWYEATEITTSCKCKTATVMAFSYVILPGDYTSEEKADIWTDMKSTYGFVDDDKIADATKEYNCHSYVYNGSSYWVNSPGSWFWDTGLEEGVGGCWTTEQYAPEDSSATAYTTAGHSCLIEDEKGKVGEWALCKNNSKKYGPFPESSERYPL